MTSHRYSFSHDPGLYKFEGTLTLSSHTPPAAVEAVKSLTLTDHDLFVVSYPKSGQTWMLNLVNLLYAAEDPEELKVTQTQTPWPADRVTYMEMQYQSGDLGLDVFNSRDPKHRIIKTHLPIRFYRHALETSGAKVIHVLRNPMDALVSYYKFYKVNHVLGNFTGDWEEFFTMYKRGDVFWGDLVEHAAGWFDFNKDRKESLIIHYEDMKEDLRGSVSRVASFLGQTLSSDVIDIVTEKLSIENMKKDTENLVEGQKDLPHFFSTSGALLRKGQVGGWREYFGPEQIQYIQDNINTLAKPVGLQFKQT